MIYINKWAINADHILYFEIDPDTDDEGILVKMIDGTEFDLSGEEARDFLLHLPDNRLKHMTQEFWAIIEKFAPNDIDVNDMPY